MAVISGFFNASESSGKRDRVYSAEDFGAIFDGIISDGIFKAYGDTPFAVVPGDAATGHLNITVKMGRAWFDKTWTLNDSDATVELDSRDASLNRIDGIYIVVDKDSRQNSITKVTGTEAIAPVAPTPTDVPDHIMYHLIATVYVSASDDTDKQIETKEITNMIGLDGGAPYVESLVTDPDVTVDTILKNLENEFDSYQSEYGDQFTAWMDSIKDTLGTLTSDQIIEVAELIADTYSTDYLSGGYPYLSDDCLYLSSAKNVLPPVIINFGFVTGSMYPNENANELTVLTSPYTVQED